MMERKPFVKADLHGPRNRSQIKDFLAYPDKDPFYFFARMKQQHPQLSDYSNREIAQWIKLFNEHLAAQVITERKGVELPERLGIVMTGVCKLTDKTAGCNIDYRTSAQVGVTVPYRNNNTEGYVAKIYYTNNIPRCKFKNRNLWRFKPCRALSRAVSEVMKMEGGYKRYMAFTRKSPVSHLFRKPKISKPSRKQINEEETRKKMEAEYDEFSFD
jgi:hypothetical protein